ncbi:uncharacterized protein LOC142351530 [Convolutriloba macropyga]|uniref:uncharacterized protein LOC142351530 n=1 Tax=Convolutriloba macropyga TaxID=536237 RepID=UPI003F52156A
MNRKNGDAFNIVTPSLPSKKTPKQQSTPPSAVMRRPREKTNNEGYRKNNNNNSSKNSHVKMFVISKFILCLVFIYLIFVASSSARMPILSPSDDQLGHHSAPGPGLFAQPQPPPASNRIIALIPSGPLIIPHFQRPSFQSKSTLPTSQLLTQTMRHIGKLMRKRTGNTGNQQQSVGERASEAKPAWFAVG